MRKIEFRGLRVNGQGWIYGDLNHIDGKTYIFNRDGLHLDSTDCYEVKPETVGQFTGENDWDLHTDDHEHKRIYEGDRCVMDSIHVGVPHCGREGVVLFREGAFWLDFDDDAIPVWSDAYYLTVTGNIHEK